MSAAAVPPRIAWRATARAGWDRVSIYLPLILMVLLALGSYWLVRSIPVNGTPGPALVAVHEPDYFMRAFSIKTFDAQGALKSEVLGTELRHFPDNDTIEIDQARIRSFDPQGRLTQATANRALSNGDGSEVQLFGNAIVVREASTDAAGQPVPRAEYHSEFLHAYVNAQRVKSHLPVLMVRGSDQVTGDRMEYDQLAGVLQLQGHVHSRLAPRSKP